MKPLQFTDDDGVKREYTNLLRDGADVLYGHAKHTTRDGVVSIGAVKIRTSDMHEDGFQASKNSRKNKKPPQASAGTRIQ